MPLQHAHPEMLRAMRRPSNGERYLEIIDEFRRRIPGVTMRSTFIVGFPGETDEHVAYLEAWIGRAQLDRVGFFTYSREDGTPAATLAAQIPAAAKRRRLVRLREAQRLAGLRDRLEFLARGAARDVVVFGDGAPRLPNTLCFAAPKFEAQTLLMRLDLGGVAEPVQHQVGALGGEPFRDPQADAAGRSGHQRNLALQAHPNLSRMFPLRSAAYGGTRPCLPHRAQRWLDENRRPWPRSGIAVAGPAWRCRLRRPEPPPLPGAGSSG